MSTISLRQLEVFRAVMRSGTVTEAARLLRVSQPAVTRILRHTEDRLGFDLFVREKGRLLPTSEAMTLFGELENVFTNINYVLKTADDLRLMRTGRVSLASIPALATTVVAHAVSDFREHHPTVSLTLRSLANSEVVALVANNQVDIGIAFSPFEDPAIEVVDFLDTDLVCVFKPGHPIGRRQTVELADVQAFPLISFSHESPLGHRMDGAFSAAGFQRVVATEINHSFLACALVAAGAGIALLDRLTVNSGVFPGLEYRPFRPQISVACQLLISRHRRLSRVAHTFIDTLLACAAAPRWAPSPSRDGAVVGRGAATTE
jgi:DNA-binding transcriptional LysR family regulator